MLNLGRKYQLLRIAKVFVASVVSLLALATHASGHPMIRSGHQPLGGPRNVQTVTSSNWSGYVWVGKAGTFSSIKTTVRVPGPECPLASAFLSYTETDTAEWTGLDGFDNGTVEQNGLDQLCDQFGRAHYQEWFELYPANPIYGPDHPQPNSLVTMRTTYQPKVNKFRFRTGSWVVSRTAPSGMERDSVEVITEAPFDGEVMPTTPFTTPIPYSADPALHHGKEIKIILNDPTDGSSITPSPIADYSFTASWAGGSGS